MQIKTCKSRRKLVFGDLGTFLFVVRTRVRTYVRGNFVAAWIIVGESNERRRPKIRQIFARQDANVLSALVKRLSRTEECPVDILRSKCGARVRDFDVEHIELLIAKAQAASESTTNFSIPQRSLINRFAINSEAINRALRNKQRSAPYDY